MRVRDWMSPDPKSVTSTTTVDEARGLLHYYGIRHLPVVDRDRVVGMVSDRDVRVDPTAWRRAMFEGRDDSAEGRPVRTVMSAPPYVIGIDESVEAAARLMLSRRISALPVVDEDHVLKGIITTTDCLLASLTPEVAAE